MSTTLQYITAGIVVLASVAYLVRRFVRHKGNCGHPETRCPQCDADCPLRDKRKR